MPVSSTDEEVGEEENKIIRNYQSVTHISEHLVLENHRVSQYGFSRKRSYEKSSSKSYENNNQDSIGL